MKWYDIRFCPQNTLLTLDYPLLIDCGSLSGADAVHKYIQAVQTEQIFLTAFDKDYVVSVLEKYDPNYQDMIENICSIVLTDMIGHIAIKKPLQDAEFLTDDYTRLSKTLGQRPVSDIEHIVEGVIKEIVDRFFGSDGKMLAYLCCETNNIAVRIHTANQYRNLSKVFR